MKGSKTDLEGLRVFLKRELKIELKRFFLKERTKVRELKGELKKVSLRVSF